MAVAATIAGALLGGGALVHVIATRENGSSAAGVHPARDAGSLLPVLEDPALNGGSVLSNLTETELESLLARMES